MEGPRRSTPNAIGEWIAALAEAGRGPHCCEPPAASTPSCSSSTCATGSMSSSRTRTTNGNRRPAHRPSKASSTCCPRRTATTWPPLLKMLDTLFRNDYWLYFRLAPGGGRGSFPPSWKSGRCAGGPGASKTSGSPAGTSRCRSTATCVPEKRAELDEHEDALDVEAFDLPVWISELPSPPRHLDSLSSEPLQSSTTTSGCPSSTRSSASPTSSRSRTGWHSQSPRHSRQALEKAARVISLRASSTWRPSAVFRSRAGAPARLALTGCSGSARASTRASCTDEPAERQPPSEWALGSALPPRG